MGELFNPDNEFIDLIAEGVDQEEAKKLILERIIEMKNETADFYYAFLLEKWTIRSKKDAEKFISQKAEEI